MEQRANRKNITGKVVKNKMEKSIVVSVERKVKHPMYGKFVKKTSTFMAHDEKNEAKTGDLVNLIESRPLSRDKRWVLQSIIRRAGQAPDVNV